MMKYMLRSPRAFFGWFSLFVFTASFAFSHNPISSWSKAQLRSDALDLKIELATESAWLFLADPSQTAPNVEGSLIQLKAKAGEAYHLSVDGVNLQPRQTDVTMRDEDGVELRLIFDRPKAGLVHFDALYLKSLTADHRTTLTLVDEAENVIRSEILNAEKPSVDMVIPGASVVTDASASAQLGPVVTATPVTAAQPAVSFKAFLKLGIEHILTGYDHLLFLFGLLIVCRKVSSMMLIVTCFTVAHSLTLALAALNIVSLPSHIVEPLIAASIVFVGAENLFRHGEPKRRWMLTFAFGLIHGFGFASVLREVGLGAGGSSLFVPLFSFNFGVEIGQLVVMAIALPLFRFLRRVPTFLRYGERAISWVILLLGAYWFLKRIIA